MRRLVLRGVHVVDETGDVLRDHAVVIEGDRITRVAPAQDVEAGASDEVFGDGRYVVPGLADMHVHHDDVGEAALYLANGITTVRNMFGAPFHLALQRRYASGSILGPRLVTTSPIIDGVSPTGGTMWPGSVLVHDERAAADVVDAAVDRGYAQIKAYSFLSVEALRGLGRAATAAGVRLVGHCPESAGFEAAIDAGQTCFEHLTGIEIGHLRAVDVPAYGPGRATERFRLMAEHLDLEAVRRLARRCSDQEIWNCPTLVVTEGMATSAGDRKGDPTLAYVSSSTLSTWAPANDARLRSEPFGELAEARRRLLDRLCEVVRIFREEGAPVLAGTDTPNPWVVPGFSLHDELEYLAHCGYTPFEALRAATAEPARFLGESNDWGVVKEGMRADLVLTAANPLRDIAALRIPAAVVVGGKLLRRDALDEMLSRRARAVKDVADPDAPELPTHDAPVVDSGLLQRTIGGVVTGCCRFRRSSTGDGTMVDEAEASYDDSTMRLERRSRVRLRDDGTVDSATTSTLNEVGERTVTFDGAAMTTVDIDGYRSVTAVPQGRVVPSDRISANAFAQSLTVLGPGRRFALDIDEFGGSFVPIAVAGDATNGWHVTVERASGVEEVHVAVTAGALDSLTHDTWMGPLEVTRVADPATDHGD